MHVKCSLSILTQRNRKDPVRYWNSGWKRNKRHYNLPCWNSVGIHYQLEAAVVTTLLPIVSLLGTLHLLVCHYVSTILKPFQNLTIIMRGVKFFPHRCQESPKKRRGLHTTELILLLLRHCLPLELFLLLVERRKRQRGLYLHIFCITKYGST